jgi:hypothetical protein
MKVSYQIRTNEIQCVDGMSSRATERKRREEKRKEEKKSGEKKRRGEGST